METLPLQALRSALDEARRIPVALADDLGVDPPALPRSILRCDTSLPYSITLGKHTHARLVTAITEHDRFERYNGVTAATRAAHRALLLAGDGRRPPNVGERGRARTQEAGWRAAGSDEVLGRRLAWWSRWLADNRLDPTRPDGFTTEITAPPVGGLIARPQQNGFHIVGSTKRGSRGVWALRPAPLRAGRRTRHRFDGHALHAWYQTSLAMAARRAGIEIIEYVGPCEAMPNALARPRFEFRQWDRWGTTSSYLADQLSARMTGPSRIALASANETGAPISLTCFSPANGYSEPRLETLLLTSFRDIPTGCGPNGPWTPR